MAENKKMTCIVCPLGCTLEITKDGESYNVSGNKCPRGKKYAIEEMTAPKRMVTSTVKINGGSYPVLPVKTFAPIPKEKIFAVMEILKTVTVDAPINVGDIIVANIAGTGVNIVATHASGITINKVK